MAHRDDRESAKKKKEEEELRKKLKAAGDSIQPRKSGLGNIRGRISAKRANPKKQPPRSDPKRKK